jgi:transcriptional regulator with XRE-family HTH domain
LSVANFSENGSSAVRLTGGLKVFIGARIRQLRQEKGLSQGDIEETTGLLRCYISRVEHGHTVPSLETLERFAAALDVPLYQLFYRGEEPPPTNLLTPPVTVEELAEKGGATRSEARFLLKLKGLLHRIGDNDRDVLLDLAKRLAAR